MADKTPIRTVFTGSTATGLAEFQSGDTVGLTHGGIGASLSIGSAGQVLKVNSGASALEFGNVEAVLNIDGMTDGTSITIADGDDFAISDGGTEKKINASQIKTYVSAAPTITGTAVMADLDISGDVDVDGTLETDALTINGATLAETISDTVGAMVGSNTETGITVTYEDGDNTLDFALGAAQTTITSIFATDLKIGEDDQTKIDFETADTIHFYAGNQNQIKIVDGAIVPITDNDIDLGTSSLEFKDAYFDGTVTADAFAGPLTGNADTATALATARTIAGQSFDGTGNIAIASTDLSNTSNITLLDGTQTLTNKTLTSPKVNEDVAVTSTATELNKMDGNTSATSTTVADADRVVMNDNGTMVQVAVTDLAAYFDDEITAMGNLVETGALDAGSITSGFGTIDTGSSTITTTGLISGGSLDIDNVLINGTTIGHTDDTDLMTVADGLLTVAGEVQMTTLDIGGTNVTATAAELNFSDGVTSAIQTQMDTKTTKGFAIASALVFG